MLLSTRDLRLADRGVMLALTVPNAGPLGVSSVGLLAMRGDTMGVPGPTLLPAPVGKRGADGLSCGVPVALPAKRGVNGGRAGFDNRLRSDDMSNSSPSRRRRRSSALPVTAERARASRVWRVYGVGNGHGGVVPRISSSHVMQTSNAPLSYYLTPTRPSSTSFSSSSRP